MIVSPRATSVLVAITLTVWLELTKIHHTATPPRSASAIPSASMPRRTRIFVGGGVTAAGREGALASVSGARLPRLVLSRNCGDSLVF